MRLYECVDACKKNPLVTIDHRSSLTVRDLLLSKIAIGSYIEANQVKQALDELINLNCPLINRILEIAALHCALSNLFIYCANSSEFESMRSKPRQKGFFNEQERLIVLSPELPLSQLLIHELTHAVRYFVMQDNLTTKQHKEFCKHQFLFIFKRASKHSGPAAEENEELYSIKKMDSFLSGDISERQANCKYFSKEWNRMSDRLEKINQAYYMRTQEVEIKQQIREDFYAYFKPYEESEYAEEFLSYFLQYFVSSFYHKKVQFTEKWSIESDKTAKNAELFDLIWSTLSPTLSTNFIKNDFRRNIDNYKSTIVKSFFNQKNIIELTDSEFYSISLAEPDRINNTFKMKL